MSIKAWVPRPGSTTFSSSWQAWSKNDKLWLPQAKFVINFEMLFGRLSSIFGPNFSRPTQAELLCHRQTLTYPAWMWNLQAVAVSREHGASPSWRLCPHFPPSSEENGQNQPFSANFWIFAPSESHFAPRCPTENLWCRHSVFRSLY